MRFAKGLGLFVSLLTCCHGADSDQGARVSIDRRAPHRADRAARPPASIRMDVQTVLIPVTVLDAHDRPVLGLRAGDFRLFEDNVEQRIASFSREDAPVSLGIVFDTSGSMDNKTDKALAAVGRFLNTAIRGDEYFLIRFADSPRLLVPHTRSTARILQELSMVRAQGKTALYDAIYMSIQETRAAANTRRALLVLSDGGDNNSRYSGGEILDLVMESDVRVHSIGLLQHTRLMDKLASLSGGESYVVRSMQELPEMIDKLSDAIRGQYVLGYRSTNQARDGKYRRIRVEMGEAKAAQMRVSWRRGYYAPSE
jgi:Ca-activated chloride channel homolog